jgi:phenylacetate-CoA ligase
MGVDIRKLPLRFGIFGAEPWSESMRHDLEARIGLKAIDLYGLSEIIGPGVAVECHEAQNGLHGWEDHFLFEVIDHKTLDPVPAGEAGELVITTLSKQALPMVRYRTRDITRLAYEPCRCGRTHVRIMRVTGRDDDMLIIRGVNVFPTQIEELILKERELEPHYQLEITRPGNLDEMTVVVERSPGAGAVDGAAAGAKLAHRIKSLIGVTAEVRVVAPSSIERSLGKAKRVVDKRTTS